MPFLDLDPDQMTLYGVVEVTVSHDDITADGDYWIGWAKELGTPVATATTPDSQKADELVFTVDFGTDEAVALFTGLSRDSVRGKWYVWDVTDAASPELLGAAEMSLQWAPEPNGYVPTSVSRAATQAWVHAIITDEGASDGQVPVFDIDLGYFKPGSVAGSGDVVGPSSSVDERVALFDGTTGKLLKQASQKIADLLARANHTGTQLAATISDFASAALAAATAAASDWRSALELGNSATLDVGTTAGTVAAGDKGVTDAERAKLGYITVSQLVDLDAMETRVDALDAAVIMQGGWDASSGVFPGGGTAQAGHLYYVTVAGTVDNVAFSVNDRIIALTDNASTATYADNWFRRDYNEDVISVAGLTGTITPAALRSALSLVVGTDVQAYDAELAAVSGLTFAAGNYIRLTGAASAEVVAPQTTANISGAATPAVKGGRHEIWSLTNNVTSCNPTGLENGEMMTVRISNGTSYTWADSGLTALYSGALDDRASDGAFGFIVNDGGTYKAAFQV